MLLLFVIYTFCPIHNAAGSGTRAIVAINNHGLHTPLAACEIEGVQVLWYVTEMNLYYPRMRLRPDLQTLQALTTPSSPAIFSSPTGGAKSLSFSPWVWHPML